MSDNKRIIVGLSLMLVVCITAGFMISYLPTKPQKKDARLTLDQAREAYKEALKALPLEERLFDAVRVADGYADQLDRETREAKKKLESFFPKGPAPMGDAELEKRIEEDAKKPPATLPATRPMHRPQYGPTLLPRIAPQVGNV